jgi:ParB-like chromosome segregation protein Spo0J
MKVIDVPVKDIKVKYRFRQPSDQKVNGLVESIKQCGLIHPINIDSSNYLISGYHRLLAHQKLNQEHIPCIVRNGDKRMSDLIQVDENLMVNSLSALEFGIHILEREKLMDDMGLLYKRGDNRYTSGGSKLTIQDLARSIGLNEKQYKRRKQIASNLCEEAISILKETEYANDLINLVTLSNEKDSIQINVANRLASGSTSGWKTAMFEAKLEDYILKTTPNLDYRVKDRFGLPQSIMKFNDAGSELKNIINLVNQDEELRPIKSSTRFGLTPVRLHQMNPDQCSFSIDYYTDPNYLVCDPFSGRSTTAITSLYLQRRFIGFGIDEQANQKTRDVINKHMTVPNENWNIIDGDGCEMEYLKDQSEIIDAVYSSPPYYRGAESYSDDPRDLCNMSIDQFDERIDLLFSNLKRLMKRSSWEDKKFYPVIFVVGTSRLGKNGIFDMTHSFQRIAKDHDFIFHDQMFVQLNNPYLSSSLERNYRNRYIHKSYESQIVFIKY